MTRMEYERLPHLAVIWLDAMSAQAQDLYDWSDGTRTDAEGEAFAKKLKEQARQALSMVMDWSPVTILEYLYYSFLNEAAIAHEYLNEMTVTNDEEGEQLAETLMQESVLMAWVHACEKMIDDMGGKVE